MLKNFPKYLSVGVINTLIHWVTFIACIQYGQPQSLANFLAFCVAVTFSFFANAKWTFNAEATTIRYMMYVFFMGMIAVLVGSFADRFNAPPVVTLMIFSVISLLFGFISSTYIIFRDRK